MAARARAIDATIVVAFFLPGKVKALELQRARAADSEMATTTPIIDDVRSDLTHVDS